MSPYYFGWPMHFKKAGARSPLKAAGCILLVLLLGLGTGCSSSEPEAPEPEPVVESAAETPPEETPSEALPADQAEQPGAESAADTPKDGTPQPGAGELAGKRPTPQPLVQQQPGQQMAMSPSTGLMVNIPKPIVLGMDRTSERISFQSAFPDTLKEPTVHIAVFTGPTAPERGGQVALILADREKDRLEANLGMAVKIAFVSMFEEPIPNNSLIRYRKDYFRAAVKVADTLPGIQNIKPMSEQESIRLGVDLIIYVSDNYN